MKIIVSLQDRKIRQVTIESVLHVRQCRNLLSLGQLMEKGLEVRIEPEEGCSLYKDGLLTGIARMHKRLFLLDTIHSSPPASELDESDRVFLSLGKGKEKEHMQAKPLSAELWYRWLGHISYQTIRSMGEAVGGMTLSKGKEADEVAAKCEDCVKGTISRKPFSVPQHPATRVLERIHSDVCGPMEVMSLGRKRYFVLFTDEYTRYVTGYFMQQKSEVFDYFKEYCANVERLTGEKVKALRTDGGGEYQGNQFQEYLRKHGIKSECTAPYTPQENGIAERLNRTLLNKMLSMMSAAGAPKGFWKSCREGKPLSWEAQL